MEYQNATALLPEELLHILQDYAEGCILYIPNRQGNRQNWGESTRAKEVLRLRNEAIKKDRKTGLSVFALSQKYFLAESTIRKIIYQK